MTDMMTIGAIVGTIMTGIIHPGRIAIIDNLTGVVDTRTTEEPVLQQVTTRSKGKQLEWEVQEAVRKMAKEWVEEANNSNECYRKMLYRLTRRTVEQSNSRSQLYAHGFVLLFRM